MSVLRPTTIPALVLVALIAATSGPAAGAPAKLLQPSSIVVHLVPAAPGLTAQCALAANLVQFAVPCPNKVPSKAGVAMSCPPAIGAELAPCVGLEGLAEYRVFVLDFENFDVPRRYVGIDGRAVGHLFIEARKASNAPARPCIRGIRTGTTKVKSWRATVYVCPNDSPFIERTAQHGEGGNVGHLVIEWRAGGLDYVASAHGHTTANLTLLRQLADSIRLVEPGS